MALYYIFFCFQNGFLLSCRPHWDALRSEMGANRQNKQLTSLEIRCQSGSFATASFRMSTSGQP